MILSPEIITKIIIRIANESAPTINSEAIPKNCPASTKDCKRVVELIKTLEPLDNILNEELYHLCANICQFYSSEKISTQDVASLITELTNKIH